MAADLDLRELAICVLIQAFQDLDGRRRADTQMSARRFLLGREGCLSLWCDLAGVSPESVMGACWRHINAWPPR